MYRFCLVIFLIVSISLILLIMLQQNKNNNISGILDNRVLGNILNSGSLNDGLTRLIIILAILFFLLSLLLGNMNSAHNKKYIFYDKDVDQQLLKK